MNIHDWLSDQSPLEVLDASSAPSAPKRFVVLEPTGDAAQWDGADPHWFDSADDARAFLQSIYDPAASEPAAVGFV